MLFFFVSLSSLFRLTFFVEFFLLFLQFCLFILLPVFRRLSLIPLLSFICSSSASLCPVPPLSSVFPLSLSISPVPPPSVSIVPDHLWVHQLRFSPSFMLPPALLTTAPKPCRFPSCASSPGILWKSLFGFYLFTFQALRGRQNIRGDSKLILWNFNFNLTGTNTFTHTYDI